MPSNREEVEPMETDANEVMDDASREKLAVEKKLEGNSHYSKKEYSDAIRLYTEAIELCPKVSGYYGNRSAAYMMAKNYKSALDDAQMSTKLDIHFAKGYFREGKCHIALGNSAAALLSLQKAKDMDPNNHSIMGEVRLAQQLCEFEQQAKMAAAKKDFRRVVYCMDRCSQISTACVRYKVMKAEYLALLGRYDEAQSLAQDVLRLDQVNAEAVYVRALCHYYDDNIDKAKNFFIHALKLSPDLTKARDSLRKAKLLAVKKEEGNLAFKSGNLEQAYELYAEALKIDENNRKTNAKLRCNKALVAKKMKKFEEAIEDATAAIELDEKYIKAYLRRAECYKETEQFEEAVRDYKRVFEMERTREHKEMLKKAEHELKLSQRKDYYKILGVSKDASESEIKKAYRKRALLHHPDRHSHDSEEVQKENEKKFKEIGEAYAILSDPKKKDRFDRGEDLDGPSMGDFDASNIFQMFFGGAGGAGFGGGGGPFHFQTAGGGGHQEFHFGF